MKLSILTPSIRPKGLEQVQRSLANQTFQDFEWLVEMGIPERGCDLSAAFNRMLRRAKGDIILIYQDYISIKEDVIEQVYNNQYENSNTLFTYSVGWDWRDKGPTRSIKPQEWEIDFASAPLRMFRDISGFDERFDNGWSWENVNLAYRAKEAGYKFKVCPQIKAKATDHNNLEIHPFRGKNENGELSNKILQEEINQGKWKLTNL